jgi:putative phage-type endonuclease
MKYTTHELIQNTPEWLAYRANCYNASDAGTALGVNPYRTRQELIRELATGMTKEIDAGTQRRFDDGHRFEKMALPLAEAIIGEPLSATTASMPVDGLKRRLSASLDGATFGDTENVEHKTLSESLAAALDRGELPEQYPPQMEQGMMITGATRCLFIASKWDKAPGDDVLTGKTYGLALDESGNMVRYVLIDAKHVWYESNPAMRAKIIAAWKQVEADVEAYQHVEEAPAAVAAPITDLPALMVEIAGSVTASNLTEWKTIVTDRIAGINTDLQTDQDFADADSMVKFLDDGEKKIDLVKSTAQSKAADIDAVFRALDEIKATMRAKRLELDKLVKARKESIKIEIMQVGKDELAKHIASLNKRLAKVQMPPIPADFATAIKGKRNLAAMRGAVADLVAAKKIESNEIADKITINLQALNDGTRLPNADYSFLFSDYAQLILKAPDDLALVIKSRIADHLAAEAKREEETRARIRAEEEAKATAKAKAEQEAEIARNQKAINDEAARQLSIAKAEQLTKEQAEEERTKRGTTNLGDTLITEPAAPAHIGTAKPIGHAAPNETAGHLLRGQINTALDRCTYTELKQIADFIIRLAGERSIAA